MDFSLGPAGKSFIEPRTCCAPCSWTYPATGPALTRDRVPGPRTRSSGTHVHRGARLDRSNTSDPRHGTTRVFEPVDREAGFAQFSGWQLNDLMDRFAAVRTSNIESLDGLVQLGDLDRRGVHPTFGEVTVSQLLATWVVHDLNHLGQIVKTMAKQYTDAVGPWREFLPIIDAI